jgi:hypothetical protein
MFAKKNRVEACFRRGLRDPGVSEAAAYNSVHASTSSLGKRNHRDVLSSLRVSLENCVRLRVGMKRDFVVQTNSYFIELFV